MHRRVSGDDAVDEDAEVLDLGTDHVAGPQARASAGAYPGRRPGRDDVTRLQGHGLARRRDELGDVADHVRRAAVLLELVVDPQADSQVVRVRDEPGRGQAWAERQRAVAGLRGEPVVAEGRCWHARPTVVAACRDVVRYAVPRDVREGLLTRDIPTADADHDGELALPVQPRRLRAVDGNVVERTDDGRRRRLEEEE